MIGVNWPQCERVINAVKARLLFHDRLATGLLVAVIMLWYLIQVGVVIFGWNKDSVQWMFTTKSFPEFSPGLFFAIVSHAYLPQLTHLFGNVAFLWLFAGDSEQHMRRAEVVGFFVITSLASVLLGTGISGDSTMGASGGVFAFIGFYCVHMVLKHRDEFKFNTLSSGGLTDTPLRTYWGLILVLSPILLVPYILGQLAGHLPAGRTDVIGHLIGLLCGIAYATVRRRRS